VSCFQQIVSVPVLGLADEPDPGHHLAPLLVAADEQSRLTLNAFNRLALDDLKQRFTIAPG